MRSILRWIFIHKPLCHRIIWMADISSKRIFLYMCVFIYICVSMCLEFYICSLRSRYKTETANEYHKVPQCHIHIHLPREGFLLFFFFKEKIKKRNSLFFFILLLPIPTVVVMYIHIYTYIVCIFILPWDSLLYI